LVAAAAKRRAFGNGVTSSMVHGPNDRLTDLTHAFGAAAVHDVDYGDDGVCNFIWGAIVSLFDPPALVAGGPRSTLRA
jgi:hypothetical protein